MKYLIRNLSKIIMDTMTTASDSHVKQNKALINGFLISPKLDNYGLLGNSLKGKSNLMQIGYSEALETI
ncbi:hypothetical protein L3V82_00080 [Thiotrichales bacterium 19S3-7]|nr:hypothetical protein [Thiotrichales bacterium 19S3-7]MCF6800564.1 hypothetical protein [Thiotrichales bacterium 19S3-11]